MGIYLIYLAVPVSWLAMQVAEKHQGDGLRAGRAGARWVAPILLFLFVVAIYWKLVLTDQYTMHDAQDHAWQILPWYQFQATEWHAGRFPLWDAHEWGGQPVLGAMLTGAAYPVNWVLSLMPLRDGRIRQDVLHWYYVLIHYMGALFCYFLLRDLKRSVGASLLAAAAFGTAGFFGAVGWPQMLNGAVWAPLVFLFFFRMLRGERPIASAALAGTFLGISFLSGHHQAPLFVGVFLFFLSVYWLLTERRWIGQVGALAVCGLFVFLASALQTLPAYEFGREAVRWVSSAHPVGWQEAVPYYVHAEYSLHPLSLLGAVFPMASEGHQVFIGLVVLFMAIFALATGWADKTVRLWAAIALGGVAGALGGFTALHGLLYSLLPLLNKARTPSMAILMYHLGLCVLCAYGIDAYADGFVRARTDWTRWLPRCLLAFGAGLAVLLLVASFLQPAAAVDYDHAAMIAIAASLIGGVLLAWNRGALSVTASLAALGLILLFEIGAVTATALPPREKGWPLLENMVKHDDLVAFLRRQPGAVRVEVDRKEIPYNFGDWQGIDAFETYVVGLTRNVERFRDLPAKRQLFGINYYLGAAALRPDQVEVYTSPVTGLKVFANPNAFPRVWSVHETRAITSEEDIVRELSAPRAELAQREFQFGIPPVLATCAGPDDVQLLRRGSARLVIDADMKCRGMVVAGETFFPGWKATVDGNPTPIHEAYSMLRGVVVEAGRHRIEIVYRPASVYWGAALTALGLVGAAALAAFGKL
jgi:hypothetical protein